MTQVRVHKITLSIVDFEGNSDKDVEYAVSNNRHFSGAVMEHVVADTEWDGDDHPLNGKMTLQEFNKWLEDNDAKILK